jgi:hypothetical protein
MSCAMSTAIIAAIMPIPAMKTTQPAVVWEL